MICVGAVPLNFPSICGRARASKTSRAMGEDVLQSEGAHPNENMVGDLGAAGPAIGRRYFHGCES